MSEEGKMAIEAVRFEGPRKVGFKQLPDSLLKENQVRIKALFSGISHGTEMAFYRGTAPFYKKRWNQETRLFVEANTPEMTYPISYGYANVGRVIECGSKVRRLSAGDIVFTYSPHVTVYMAEESKSILLPDSIDPEIGVFVANLGTAYNGILHAHIHLGENVVVFGLGSIGQMVVQMAKLSGAERVIGVDMIEKRCALAKKLGADEVLNPQSIDDIGLALREIVGKHGADVVIEVTGSDQALHQAIRAVGVQGTVIALSFYQGPAQHLRLGEEFHHNAISIRCAQASHLPLELSRRWDMKRRMKVMLSLLTRLNLKELITHRYDFKDAAQAYQMVDLHPEQVVQVILKYS